ncbi:MAG: hypothetical protein AABX85_04090 [Nanoarchaeota archaeon]
MRDITINEMNFILKLIKNPREEFNARTMAKKIGMSHMGALKIAKKLEKEKIVNSKQIGKGIYYTLDLKKDYAAQYVKFLLNRETEQAHPYVRRWINELKKISSADIIILFGSVLTKYEGANDIDVLLITSNKKFDHLKKEIESINNINIKKIHPIYQSGKDLEKNINEKDKVILNAIRGVVIIGEDKFIELIKNESNKR